MDDGFTPLLALPRYDGATGRTGASMGERSNLGPPRRRLNHLHAPVAPRSCSADEAGGLRSALHDRLGPALANLAMRLELAQDSVTDPDVRSRLAELRREAGALVQEFNRIIHGEPPERLATAGLVAAAREACQRTERPGLEIAFTVSGQPIEPPEQVSSLLYRAVLEGTANVARHSEAAHCQVQLRFSDTDVSLEVRDDGKGPPADQVFRKAPGRGLGLANLRGSATALGGELRLRRPRSGGAALQIRLPLPRGHRPPPAAPSRR